MDKASWIQKNIRRFQKNVHAVEKLSGNTRVFLIPKNIFILKNDKSSWIQKIFVYFKKKITYSRISKTCS